MKKIPFFILMVLLATMSAHSATNYGINVGGVEVNSDNCNRITGEDIKSGYGVYNASTNTLTLYSIRISRDDKDEYGIHNRSCNDLTIVFNGTCDIDTYDNALKLERSTTLNAASGSATEFSTSARICANLKSYNYYIKGSGSISFYSSSTGYEAIKGNGTGSTNVYFQGAEVEFNSRNRSAMSSFAAYFQSGADVVIRANGSYASVSNVSMSFSGGAVILDPYGAYYSNNTIYDSSGNQITSQFIYISSNYGLLINYTNFPSINFRNAMLALYPQGYLTTSELNNLTYLDVEDEGISNMTGIEKLTALKTLRCGKNNFSSLNLNSNTSLTYLSCSNNTRLTTLNISSCTKLETLECDKTGITSLNLDNLSKLKTLDCSDTKLTSLTVSGKSQLTSVVCTYCTSLTQAAIFSNSALATLNIRNCTALTSLSCYNNNSLTLLNVVGNTALTYLDCQPCSSLESITGLINCTALTTLYCGNCAITDLYDLNSLTNLTKLYCQNNKLTNLILTDKTKLRSVVAYNNPQLKTAFIHGNSALTYIDISSCSALRSLDCHNNALTTLNVANNTALEDLDCEYNFNLATIIGLGDCVAMHDLNVGHCSFTDLSFCNTLPNLFELNCYDNRMTALSLTNNSRLYIVDASQNAYLTTVNIYNNSDLYSLYLEECQSLTTANIYSNRYLKNLTLWYCTSLDTLECYSNALTTLNVSGCSSLTRLRCYSNPNLTTISGLSGCRAITFLNCNNCAMTDMSVCNSLPNLSKLYCAGNRLTTLTLTNMSKLTLASAANNPLLTTVNIQDNSALEALYLYDCPSLTIVECPYNALKSLYAYNCSALEGLECSHNRLTLLNVKNNPSMELLLCTDNQLTSLDVQGCNALNSLYCHHNQLSDAGMTTLVNTLPTRTASNPGYLYVLDNNNENYINNENNVFTATHLAAAQAKFWRSQRYNGTDWVDITFGSDLRGDVDGDGRVTIGDVATLIDYLLSGNASGIDLETADVDGDGRVTIGDSASLIDYLLSGTWGDEPVTPPDNHEWVDLGLPTGTLWATMNVGASSPEDYGDYFAWGETSPKSVYDWSTYKWCNGSETTLTKYSTSSSYGTVDNKTELLPEDDAAYVNWGPSWRMPTEEQIKELEKNCTKRVTTLNGVNCQLVTGPNGNSIFLPYSGAFDGNSQVDIGEYGYIWSRTLCSNEPNLAYIILCDRYYLYYGSVIERCYGFPVRPVRVAQ